MVQVKEPLKLKGKVEVLVSKGKPAIEFVGMRKTPNGVPLCERIEIDLDKTSLIDSFAVENIILNIGKDKVIQAMVDGSVNPIGRMAIGDRGTIPSDSSVPKVPVETMTSLYNEVYRADIDGVTVDVGVTPTVHEAKFVKTFGATEIPIAAFSNQAKPVVNEVGLITYNPVVQGLPRPPVWSPNAPMSDEALFSIRTFKSVPFEAANEISVTIRYTIFIQ